MFIVLELLIIENVFLLQIYILFLILLQSLCQNRTFCIIFLDFATKRTCMDGGVDVWLLDGCW